jgi:hypothetical protein
MTSIFYGIKSNFEKRHYFTGFRKLGENKYCDPVSYTIIRNGLGSNKSVL